MLTSRRTTTTGSALLLAALLLPGAAGAEEYDHARTTIVGPSEQPVMAAASSSSSGDIVFNGRGSYHSVGMSQHGAHAQAIKGRTAGEIVRSYYSGTSVDTRTPPEKIRVGIVHDTPRIRVVGRDARIRVRSSATPTADKYDVLVNAGVPVDVTVKANPKAGQSGQPAAVCDLVRNGSSLRSNVRCPTFDPEGAGRAEVFTPDGAAWTSYGSYARDSVVDTVPDQLSSGGWRLDVVVHIDLEQYLYGLAEVPYSWDADALKAQAIAGRSYALHAMLSRTPSSQSCNCHVWDSQRDQVYRGHEREVSARWGDWRTAVDATARKVVVARSGQAGYGDTRNGVVQAFYSASSHGRTENKHEVFFPSTWDYMVTVDDGWSLQAPNNFYATWSRSFSRATVASKVGLPSIDSVTVTERRASGSAKTVVFKGGGRTKTLSGDQVRWTFGLLSNGFGIGNEQWGGSGGGGGSTPPPSDLFTDDDDSIHESDIDWLANQKITLGCNPPENTRFCPKDSVTREQMAAFLVRALELPAGSATFADVPKGSTFQRDISALADAGITLGCNPPANDRYCPRDPVTREQMASFLARALDLPTGPRGVFSDVPSGSTHERTIGALAKAGITQGCNPPRNTRYCPVDPVTREQMATFLFRALG